MKSCFFASESFERSSVDPDGRKALGSGSEVGEVEEEVEDEEEEEGIDSI